jgi:hypothetical protein
MRRGANNALIGKWRIVEMGLWDRDYLDMVEPAYIQFQRNGLGEVRFGCVIASLDCTLFADAAEFTWEGSDDQRRNQLPSRRRIDLQSSQMVRFSSPAKHFEQAGEIGQCRRATRNAHSGQWAIAKALARTDETAAPGSDEAAVSQARGALLLGCREIRIRHIPST